MLCVACGLVQKHKKQAGARREVLVKNPCCPRMLSQNLVSQQQKLLHMQHAVLGKYVAVQYRQTLMQYYDPKVCQVQCSASRHLCKRHTLIAGSMTATCSTRQVDSCARDAHDSSSVTVSECQVEG